MAIILLGGASDTGRAPMAAALLRRLLNARSDDWAVESCGVLGHDGAVAEVEARDTMVHMGLDIAEHLARSLDDDLAARAALIITIDRGTALVIRARFPVAAARTYSLGELAGRARDIPDPFRMQIGAWLTYAREIESMLEAALPRIVALMPVTDDRRPTTDPSTPLRAGDRRSGAKHEAQADGNGHTPTTAKGNGSAPASSLQPPASSKDDRRLRRKLVALEEEIAMLEAEMKQLAEEMTSASAQADGKRVKSLEMQYSDVNDMISSRMKEWEQLAK